MTAREGLHKLWAFLFKTFGTSQGGGNEQTGPNEHAINEGHLKGPSL